MQLRTIKLYHRETGEMAVWNVADSAQAAAAGYFANAPEPKKSEEKVKKEKVK